MNNKFTTESLAKWIRFLIDTAKEDEDFGAAIFKETINEPFIIVGGWQEGFSEDYNDILCISKSNPNCAMCVKIAVNEGPYEYVNFELMPMPLDKNGEVDNTCIALDLDEDVHGLAEWLAGEWERITEEHNKE